MYFFHIENRQMEWNAMSWLRVTQHQGWWSNSLACGNSESSHTSGEFATGGPDCDSWSSEFQISRKWQHNWSQQNHTPANSRQTVGNCSSFDGSGQIIATSNDLTPNGGLVREIPLFQGNLGSWNIIIWPEWFVTLQTWSPLCRTYAEKPERYTIIISLHFAIPRKCNLVFQPVVFKAPSLHIYLYLYPYI